MRIYIGSNCIYKDLCGNQFLKYCLRKNWKLSLHWLRWLTFAVLYRLHIYDKKAYLTKKWRILAKLEQREELLRTFVPRYRDHCYEWFRSASHQGEVLIDDAPQFLLEAIFEDQGMNVYGTLMEESGKVTEVRDVETLWQSEWDQAEIYVKEPHRKMQHGAAVRYVVGKRVCEDEKAYRKQMMKQLLCDAALLFIAAWILLVMTLCFATLRINWKIVLNVFMDPVLLMLNFIPIFLLLLVLYALFNSVAGGFLGGSLILFVMSMIHFFKLLYRDEAFVISDILLVQEAGNMAGKYDINFRLKHWLALFLLLMIFVLLLRFYHRAKLSWKLRLGVGSISTVIFIALFGSIYQNEDLYKNHVNLAIINRWSITQQYQVHGFVYPFIYSYTYAVDKEPENYDPNAAESILDSYDYQSIPEDKKAHVIGIMLESYNDFSRYVPLSNDPYHNFHELQKESLSGNFVSNIFAGGTVASERSFLNGFNDHPRYLTPTNSFVRYFNEQGYYTEALHPSYGWFYNRRNINKYLGFQNFYYIENYFGEITYDHELFKEIIAGYERNQDRGQPYFNFTVTYQNHGPYASSANTDQTYLVRNDRMEEASYQIFNNYLAGIADTDEALKELFDYFRAQEEPVIIVIFGDHNPLLGDGNSGYLQSGMSLDLGTVEGFREYYSIPYLIWGNEAAQSMYGVTFKGDGDEFSGMYFLPYLFHYLGLEGNEYMQYLNDLYETMPVLNENYYFVNGDWKKELIGDELKKHQEFINLEYYYQHSLKTH